MNTTFDKSWKALEHGNIPAKQILLYNPRNQVALSLPKPSPDKSHWDKFFQTTETRNTNDTYQKEKSCPLTQRSARHDLLGCCL